MSTIYALSDMHGCYEEMMASLNLIQLGLTDKLIFVGDYVDGGDHSFHVLAEIMQLEKSYPDQVVVLWGNHDEWFSNWLFFEEQAMPSYVVDVGFKTVKSFFTDSELQEIVAENAHSELDLADLLHEKLLANPNKQELLSWIKEKALATRYYQTAEKIFVHAGIDEEAGKYWEQATPDYVLTGKFPATKGLFFKDIVSGHFNSEVVAKDADYLGLVYWDDQNHYFIDGNTVKSGVVPVLKYDTMTKSYSSYKRKNNSWAEYLI